MCGRKFPEDLKPLMNRKIWLCWNMELNKDGKLGKIPKNLFTGGNGSSTGSYCWGTFHEARNAALKYKFSGIGITFTDNELFGIDLDHVRNPETGELTEEAWKIIHTMAAYSEISPSGTGIHILGVGKLPKGKRKVVKNQSGADGKAIIYEMYDTGRYFTVTGNVLVSEPLRDRTKEAAAIHKEYFQKSKSDQDNPKQNKPNNNHTASGAIDLSDYELLQIMFKGRDGNLLESLFNGNREAYSSDHSKCDIRFLNALAFYTGRDAIRMDSIFRQSGLMRPKWDERRGAMTYGERSIADAINNCNEVYCERNEKTTGRGWRQRGQRRKQASSQLIQIMKSN